MTDEQLKAMSKADANKLLCRSDMRRWVRLHNATANLYLQEEHFETPDKRGTAIKQGAKNKEPEMTMEEYLLSQLDTPVVLKDGTMMQKPDGSPMTKQEAIATNILNLAMKGDVKAAQYIQNIQMRAKIMKKK